MPRLAVVGGVLIAILADCKQPKNKNTLDYDVSSRRWSRTTARPCRARDGVGVIIQAVYNDLLLVNINA